MLNVASTGMFTRAELNMGFQYSAEYRIFHSIIWPNTNTNTNSCWTEKENERQWLTCKTCSVLHVVHSALVASSSHTVKYFHSRLCQLSIIHSNYDSIKIREVTQYYSTNWLAVSWLQYIPGLWHYRRAPHVSMEATQLTSQPAVDEAFPDTHLTACYLHCSGATAAWCAMLMMLHGVTGGPTMSRRLEIWCPVYWHAAQWGWGIHYSTIVKTTAGRRLTMGR